MVASAQVFDTVELLETILYELPTRDLLFAQGVSKQWKAVIESSTKLRQALFVDPISNDPIPFFGQSKSKAFKNPLLEPLFKTLSNVESGSPIDLIDELFHKDYLLHESWKYKDASWIRMYPTQPPMQSFVYVDCIVDVEEEGELSEEFKKARCPPYCLEMVWMIKKLHKLVANIWEPGAYVSLIKSEPFRKALDLETNRQLTDLMHAIAKSETSNEHPERSDFEIVSDGDWIEYDTDSEYELDEDGDGNDYESNCEPDANESNPDIYD